MDITTRRRRALSTALALFLAIESVSAVAAVAVAGRDSGAGSRHELPAAAPAGVVQAAQGAADALAPAAATVVARTVSEDPDSAGAGPQRTTAAPAPARSFAPRLAIAKVKAPRSHGSAAGSSSSSTASSASHKGRNHFWFPSLGINRAVYSYPCSRSREPDNLVYRWGCAGANNVYLLGHAWGVFKPLHDAYVGGRLHAGMKAYYADNGGRTHTYVVKWWKLTKPTTSASWAWASQSVPSMTLQTCVGSNSQYRVMVRLVEVR
ncbi:MAG TPA: sortase [Candidatus Limnocylindrales bacterium]|nr:sortase [Candidatus Limnocylindrales bacterium]